MKFILAIAGYFSKKQAAATKITLPINIKQILGKQNMSVADVVSRYQIKN